ncbi:MAG TPA: nucleoside recognition domain-containing protein [Anaerolineales bacterium]|nr:nucleoside recognition domain-containing protein [Anaerolineales bacterium]HMV95745.1 nucleoside recognition domain-containing protein [Anaerolineales bacterium]HMX17897.1 nucleoside recognition domain-containing protein [Anaerolineales bacterium]HMX73365.1 nucleoside recognition domain-containing protein [Anaerolineales bacterium]HMZ42404.1 nucleoside recognition domain-containing protein [Anaerolineales bacterium]
MATELKPNDILSKAESLRNNLSSGFRDEIVKSLYSEAEAIAKRAVKTADNKRYDLDQKIDRLVTSPITGLPIMLILLSLIIWLTVSGANVASDAIANVLFAFGEIGRNFFNSLGFIPWWITGFIWDGVYLGLAWVVSVMLPPMAIFFPAFTFLEDLGYLPRVAFNMDWMFKKAGAHGKQSLTMAMGFGCNAAGVIATRVIDSPRERLIAILTNNFVPCNGRFPTLIMLGTVFVAAGFSGLTSSVIAAGSVVGVVLLGVVFTFLMSWILSRTVLKGEASAFTLELPPYRKPNFGRILYTSIIDRTIFVLWRAMQTAAPAGAIIWILANVHIGDTSLARAIADWLNPFGLLLGLDGVILLAYIIAIPANEIVVPTMMMMYMGAGMMIDGPSSNTAIYDLLVHGNGWTMLTAVNLMLFALLHNPCATTIMTIYKETKSLKWATLSVVMTLGTAFLVTFLTASIARLFGWA